MKNKIILTLSIIIILFISLNNIKYKTSKNDRLSNAANHISKKNKTKNFKSKYNNKNDKKLMDNINKINEYNNNMELDNNNQILNNNINKNYNLDNNLNQEYLSIQKNNNISKINKLDNNENTNVEKNIINKDNENNSQNIKLVTWLYNELNTNNTIINNYFKGNKLGSSLDSTGTNYGNKINQLLNENNILPKNCSWKIIFLGDKYYIYTSTINISNLQPGTIIDAVEYSSINDYKNIKVKIENKEQQKNIIIPVMNKYIDNNKNIDNEIFNELYKLLFSKGSIINNYFINNNTLDSTGGNNGLYSNNLLKSNLSMDRNYILSWKINKLVDKSYDIYILNNIDINNYNVGETINNVLKINTNNLNDIQYTNVIINTNINSKKIINEIK